MEPLRRHQGKVAVLDRMNVDTDQIIPKQFLKRVERSGFGQFLFHDWRFNGDGTPNQEFEWTDGRADGASILLAGKNFGCGSSREHAAWALSDFGFRVILAPSYADIFFNNCFKNGVLPIVLPKDTLQALVEAVHQDMGAYELTVDLEQQVICNDAGFEVSFIVDPFRRQCLLDGLDDIGLTMQWESRIAEYEEMIQRSEPGERYQLFDDCYLSFD